MSRELELQVLNDQLQRYGYTIYLERGETVISKDGKRVQAQMFRTPQGPQIYDIISEHWVIVPFADPDFAERLATILDARAKRTLYQTRISQMRRIGSGWIVAPPQ